MNVYKVVRGGGPYFSASVTRHEGPFFTYYFYNAWAFPPIDIPQAWLFAFDNLADAVQWATNKETLEMKTGLRIFLAEAFITSPVARVVPGVYYDAFLQYWKHPSIAMFLKDPPPGTIMCSSIKLTRRVRSDTIRRIQGDLFKLSISDTGESTGEREPLHVPG